MVSLAIEVQDMATVHNLLVVPSPRRVPTAKEMAAFVARLAPIEMATPSISAFPAIIRQPSAQAKDQDPPHHTVNKPVAIQGWAIPLGYTACGPLLFLCSLLVPDGLLLCAHILVPPMSLVLILHAVAIADPAWLGLGLLTACLLPFVLLLRHPLFLGFYLLVFAAFGSGRFWQTLIGPPFVLVCGCWLGLLISCSLALLAQHPWAQLSLAAAFALASAVVTSAARFGRLVLRAA